MEQVIFGFPGFENSNSKFGIVKNTESKVESIELEMEIGNGNEK